MARGAEAKAQVLKQILEFFPGSFMDEKVVRIPCVENGEPIEIKVTLTAAKDVIGGSPVTMTPDIQPTATVKAEPVAAEPSEDEKANLKKLLDQLF